MSTIAVLGRHPGMLAAALDVVRQAGFDAIGTTDDHELDRWLDAQPIFAVVIGGGVDEPTRQRIHRHAERLPVAPRVLDVVGGAAGLAVALRDLAGPAPGS